LRDRIMLSYECHKVRCFTFGWTTTNSATGVDFRHQNQDAENT
jgi:hypothetical protein